MILENGYKNPFFLSQFHSDEYNNSSPNHNPQGHNYPELCVFSFVFKHLYP